MKKIVMSAILLLLTLLLFPGTAYAREGICGYEGGVSSGEVAGTPGKALTLDYQEVSFVSGEPIVLKGTMIIKKSQKQGKISTTYTYTLKNTEKSATLSRTLVFDATTTTQSNGQTSEAVTLTSARETIKIGSVTYNLANAGNYQYARSNLTDPKPAVNYHQGSVWSRKVYTVGAATDGNTVTVECTGSFYGYDQYWGSAESLALDYDITSEITGKDGTDSWGGTASVSISSTSTEQLQYQKNLPDQISFDGSYVQSRKNSNILEYSCIMPEFDSKGVATKHTVTYNDSLDIETFPVQKRLPTVSPANIRGHWAENEIRIMFGLEVFKGDAKNFNPDLYMTRAEFAAAMVQIAKEVPKDPALAVKTVTTSSRTRTNTPVISPFDDVSVDNIYFNQIKGAFDRKLIDGKGNNLYIPNGTITKADAIMTFIRALGFEDLAPTPVAVTGFRDNDLIPSYARNSAYVAQKIGLLLSDSKGNMNPNAKLTKAESAILFNNLIKYMQDGIRKDYSERFVNY